MKKAMHSKNTSLFQKFKYWAIEKLAGNMPVALNLVISRPKNYEGPLVHMNGEKTGMITKCFLFSIDGNALIEAVQDVDIKSRLKDSNQRD